MAEIVVMPKIGLTAREALLREWLVEEGASVVEGAPLFEIETDKIVSEVESPASGILLRRIDPDVIVGVGEPIAVIGESDEDVSGIRLFSPRDTAVQTGAVTQSGDSPEQPETSRGEASDIRLKASPLARRRAAELGVDLATIAGSGPGGRITMKDIEDAAQAPASGAAVTAISVPPTPAAGRTEEPSRLRKAIASAMSVSAAIPQFSLDRDVEVTNLRSVLAGRSIGLESPLSLVDAVGVATARAIVKHEAFQRQWEDGWFRYTDGVHLGIAVAVEDGLIVPVLRDADRLTIEAFSMARRDLQARTSAGRLRAEESTGAVFTVSNLGPLGVDRFRALVNPPESGILAIGRARSMQGRVMMTLSLSADHRVVDGAQGAHLLMDIARFLEDPEGLSELFSRPPGS